MTVFRFTFAVWTPARVLLLLWSCRGRRAASRSAVRSARRRWPWCCPCSSRPGPVRAAPWCRGPRCSGCSWWPRRCRGCRRRRSTSGSRGRRSDTWRRRGRGDRIVMDSQLWRLYTCRVCREDVVPAQSLGADVLIVQVGEDVGDDGALLLGPLNHDGFCLLCFSLGETEKKNPRWIWIQVEAHRVYLTVPQLPPPWRRGRLW